MTASAITVLSASASGLLPSAKLKIEPVAGATGTTKIIHPDEDISLVNLNFILKTNTL